MKRVVYICPACGCRTHPLRMGGMKTDWSEYFQPRGDGAYPAPRVLKILCWWCRQFHPPEEVESCMALPKKKAGPGNSTSSTSNVLDAGLLTPFSELLAFLTATTFEDGTRRQAGKISLSFESGCWGLSLQDAETQQYAFLEGTSLDDLLLTVELKMKEDRVPWRPSKWAPKGKK